MAAVFNRFFQPFNPFFTMGASQTGHDINLANFRELITRCTYFGAGYDPANPDLTLAAANAYAAECQSALNDLTNALPVLTDEMGARRVLYKNTMAKLTRIVAAHAASSTNEALKLKVKGHVRDMRGKRAKDLPTGGNGEPTEAQISAVNVGYKNRAADFASVVATLNTDEEYKTNKTDLTKPALATLLTELNDANADVRNAQAPVDNARTARDVKFYTGPKNMVDRALMMKQEVKSTFGVKSPEYKQVSGLKFTRPKK